MTINISGSALTSWKTTIAGVASTVLGVLQASKHHTPAEAANDPLVWFSLVMALLGFFAKDGNVTGGTVGQPSTPKALAAANQAPAAGENAPKP